MTAHLIVITLGVLVCMAPLRAAAALTIYTYTGTPYTLTVDDPRIPGTYTTDMRISGSLILTNPLPPNQRSFFDPRSVQAFQFNDGRVSYEKNTTLPGSYFHFETDGNGVIVAWEINLEGATTGLPERSSLISEVGGEFANIEQVNLTGAEWAAPGPAGTWTVTAVPEPSTYALFLVGIGLVGFTAKRRMSLPH